MALGNGCSQRLLSLKPLGTWSRAPTQRRSWFVQLPDNLTRPIVPVLPFAMSLPPGHERRVKETSKLRIGLPPLRAVTSTVFVSGTVALRVDGPASSPTASPPPQPDSDANESGAKTASLMTSALAEVDDELAVIAGGGWSRRRLRLRL